MVQGEQDNLKDLIEAATKRAESVVQSARADGPLQVDRISLGSELAAIRNQERLWLALHRLVELERYSILEESLESAGGDGKERYYQGLLQGQRRLLAALSALVDAVDREQRRQARDDEQGKHKGRMRRQVSQHSGGESDVAL